MKEPTPDDERLSALLDKRLTGPQRDELLAHLAADDEDYQVFMDAADILREAEAEEAPGKVEAEAVEGARIPPRGRPAPHRWTHGTPRRFAIAAAVVGIVVLGALAMRARAAAAAGHPVRLALALDHAAQGLPGGWTEQQRPWDSERGEPAGRPAGRAAQAGVLLVDLSVAVAARDSANTELLATQLQERFDPQAAPSSPIRQIAARAGEPATALRPLLEGATERLERLGRDYLRLGAWTEAARIAAHRRDEAFFRSGATRGMLRRAERLTAADPTALDAVSSVRAALAAQGPPDWNALTERLDTLLNEVAS